MCPDSTQGSLFNRGEAGGGSIWGFDAYHPVSPTSDLNIIPAEAVSSGEGLIAITRAFNRAISGLSDNNSATYGQVWLGWSWSSLSLDVRRAAVTFFSHSDSILPVVVSVQQRQNSSRSQARED